MHYKLFNQAKENVKLLRGAEKLPRNSRQRKTLCTILTAASCDTLTLAPRGVISRHVMPTDLCPVSVQASSCSRLFDTEWLCCRLTSRWKFPKLLLCHLCDLNFSFAWFSGAVSWICFRAASLHDNSLSPCEYNFGEKAGSCRTEPERARKECEWRRVQPHFLCVCVSPVTKKSCIICCSEESLWPVIINHMHTCTNTERSPARRGHYSCFSRGPVLQDRFLVMCFLSIDHTGSSRCFILVIASWIQGSWGEKGDDEI